MEVQAAPCVKRIEPPARQVVGPPGVISPAHREAESNARGSEVLTGVVKRSITFQHTGRGTPCFGGGQPPQLELLVEQAKELLCELNELVELYALDLDGLNRYDSCVVVHAD